MPEQAALERRSFDCANAEQIGAALTTLYFANRTHLLDAAPAGRLTAECARLGGLRVERLRCTGPWGVHVPDSGVEFLAVTVESGEITIDTAARRQRYRAGDTALLLPGAAFDAETHGAQLAVTGLAMTRVRAAVAAFHGPGAAAEFRFTGTTPTTPGTARYWRHLTATVHRELLRPATALTHPVLAEQATAALATAAIAVFPHTAAPRPAAPEPVAATAIARALDHLHAHPHGAISIAELARVAGVTARALQYGFRAHHDSTPLDYHRRIRLEHAHHDLLTADPATGATVTAIAVHWGFTNPGRFAHRYRQTYGHPPSTTLHS